MHHSKSRKILIYFFLFIIIGTLNNKNLDKINLIKINTIKVSGLSEKKNDELTYRLDFLKIGNMFFTKKNEITQIINSYNLVEEFSVFKNYPSTLDIQIKKTKFLAQLKREDGNFLLGSNGKLTKINESKPGVPFIFGDFENKNFFELKEAIEKTSFEFEQIKNLFFFKSGRWDLETNTGILIKLPRDEVYESINLFFQILEDNQFKDIKLIDLRQNKQMIINE